MTDNRGLQLDRIVFIGRTYDEYCRMFDLDESALGKGPVLDCAAGPSSFTAEACEKGYKVTACDVLYKTERERLVEKGRKDIEHTFERVDGVPHLYTWKYYRSREEILSLRHRALERFANDFSAGVAAGRYIHAALPLLPFPDGAFSLVLASHFLFLYGDRLDFGFHHTCLKELVRVASEEVRVFPLQGLDGKPYPHMDRLLTVLADDAIDAKIVAVPFEFQKGSDKMLKLSKR